MSMHHKRRKKLSLIVFLISLLGLVLALVLYALRQNISLFYSPSDLARTSISANRLIRVGGMVVPKSILHEADGLTVQFKMTDYQSNVLVYYRGVLPDLFREGQGVVVKGHLINAETVSAVEVLAKHDEKYMPPEVKAILKPRTASTDFNQPNITKASS